MYFTAKLVSLLLVAAASAASAQATIDSRNHLDQVSVIFWQETSLQSASFSPPSLVPGVCNTLPCNWLDRAESVLISSNYTCTFFAFQGCEGNGTTLSGQVDSLPYNLTIESFTCNKQIEGH